MNNDRYLFRGIATLPVGVSVTKKKNVWVYGGINLTKLKPYIIGCPEGKNYIETVPVIPETVGQWTGLIDKNGVRIFEGDKVRILNYNAKFERCDPDFDCRIFNVEWNRYTWAFKNELICMPLSDYDIHDGTPFEIQVIGSIHDHLLGGKQCQ
jgi:hypothetical protein